MMKSFLLRIRTGKAAAWLMVLVCAAVWILPAQARSERALEPLPPGAIVTVFAANADFLTDMEFGPDGRLYYLDSNYQRIRVLDASGKLVSQIALPPPPEFTQFQIGQAIGLALDPDFANTGYFYVHYQDGTTWSNRVLRFRHSSGVTSDVASLLDIPLPRNPNDPNPPCIDHSGGHLAFGADGMLYVPMGDNCHPEMAQDTAAPQGAMLRINPTDGSAPADNPLNDGAGPQDDRLWAKGLRNPFGLAFDSKTGKLWVVDNGPGCQDEVNTIQAGGNYGWPVSSTSYFECVDPGPPYLPPVWEWTPPMAPTGVMVYRSGAISSWEGSLFTCSFNDGSLHRLTLDEANETIVSEEKLGIAPASCRMDVTMSPEGDLYFADTKTIYRIQHQALWLPLIRR